MHFTVYSAALYSILFAVNSLSIMWLLAVKRMWIYLLSLIVLFYVTFEGNFTNF